MGSDRGGSSKLRTAGFAAFVIAQAVVLLIAGLATLWWSGDLMGWLIYMVGYERALGAGSVIRQADGSTLLTNPGAMFVWLLPIWALGVVQISSAATILWLGLRRGRSGAS